MGKILYLLRLNKSFQKFNGVFEKKKFINLYNTFMFIRLFINISVFVLISILELRFSIINSRYMYLFQTVILICMFYIAHNSAYQLIKDEQYIKIKKFLYTGPIIYEQKNRIFNNIISYYSRVILYYELGIGIVGIVYAYKNNFWDIVFANLLVMIVSYLIIPLNIQNKLFEVKKRKSYLSTLLVFLFICIMPRIDFRDLKSMLYAIDYKYLYYLVLILLSGFAIKNIFSKRKFLSKKVMYLNQLININVIIQKKFSGITRDFILKEITPKLSMMFIISILFYKIYMPKTTKILFLSIIFTFLFSQFNQRYLLNKTFIEYSRSFSKAKLFNYILRKLIIIELLIMLIMGIISFSFDIKLVTIFIVVSLMLLFINNIIYISLSSLKEVDESKISQIEIFSGMTSALFMIGGLLWILN
jgi:hypothetical protein